MKYFQDRKITMDEVGIFLVLSGIILGMVGMHLLWQGVAKESSFFSLYTLFQARFIRGGQEQWLTLFCNRICLFVFWRFICLLLSSRISCCIFPTMVGVCFGSLLMCLWKRFLWKGIILFCVLGFPQGLFYAMALILFYKKILPFSKRGVSVKNYLLLLAFVGAGSLLEAYCNPYIYAKFLQYL